MQQIDLSGSWDLRLEAGACPVELPDDLTMSVPGENITALARSGSIPDPFFGENELDIQWIGRCDWTISRSFDVPPDELGNAMFVADSLDTIAEVRINGSTISSTDNMFSEVRAAVPPGILTARDNTIEVTFRSPELEAISRAEKLPYPIPHSTQPVQSPHRNLVRKVQCHGGWDWGPSLMVSGVYGAIRIETGSGTSLVQARTRLSKSEENWTLTVDPVGALANPGTPQPANDPNAEISLDVRLLDPEGNVVAAESVNGPAGGYVIRAGTGENADRELGPGMYRWLPSVELGVTNPMLWWPAGEGEQPLYTLEIEGCGSSLRKTVAFRSIEVQREADSDGSSFQIVVNGRPVFARGANWIPQNALPGMADGGELADLLDSAVAANMNMIRVWGGGTYESDAFYDHCDRRGILIWQDFMFSCALYPVDPAFRQSVKAEVTSQLLRLQSHPCIALWCGNNENVGSLTWFEESRANRDRYLVDYDRLNENTIGQTARELDPDRLFWPSSPAAGLDDYSVNWTLDGSGDMHYWSVWHSAEPFASYRSVTPRFCSEFGFQSFPTRDLVESYVSVDQLNVTSPQMEHHQRSPAGNELIMRTMSRYFRYPSGLDEQLYVSQVQQALAITTAVEYWRSIKPHCMGTLFWQLNDTWPVASWSSIQFGGQWKLLHYAARRFFDPLLIMAVPRSADGTPLSVEDEPADSWSICVANDTPAQVNGTATVEIRDLAGEIVFERTAPVAVGRIKSVEVFQISATEIAAATAVSADSNGVKAMPHARLFGTLALEVEGQPTRKNVFLLTAPKHYDLPESTIELTTESDGSVGTITMRADAPSFFVSLELRGDPGRFSDNLLTLLPNEPTTVSVPTQLTGDQLQNRLVVNHLANTGKKP